jgi:hypothetical protein
MTTWTRYIYEAHLTHVVCTALEAPLIAEMSAACRRKGRG